MDLCTIIDLETQVIDPDTGDVDVSAICENQPCDFQPSSVEYSNGTLIASSPKLFLPFEIDFANLLSKDMIVLISRYRKRGTLAISRGDYTAQGTNKKHIVRAKIDDWQEIDVEDKLVGVYIELREVTL